MHWDVTEVRVDGHLTLYVRFADGTHGRVKLEPHRLTGVLAPLRDPDFFSRVYISAGAVTWPGDIDLAPDAMYRMVRPPA